MSEPNSTKRTFAFAFSKLGIDSGDEAEGKQGNSNRTENLHSQNEATRSSGLRSHVFPNPEREKNRLLSVSLFWKVLRT
jgi:hypothetical protein